MIAIDRKSGVSVQVQIAEQIRYLIARGAYLVGGELPSTRTMADDLGVSFHTVRKAYNRLEDEGLVRAVPGRGFVVEPLPGGTDSDKMEVGADIIRQSVQRLIGIGLSESDIDYLFEEQLATIAGERSATKTLFVGAYREQAQECARQLGRYRFGNVVPTTVQELGAHEDAEYAICPFALQQTVRVTLHRTEVIGLDISLNHAALDLASRMLAHETVALVTRYPDAIAPLTRELRSRTGFPGQLLAGSVHQGNQHIRQIASQADAILCTPTSKSSLSGWTKGKKLEVVSAVVAEASLRALQEAVPDASRL